METSKMSGMKILVVDDEPDVLATVETEIHLSCPDCEIDMATSYEKAAEFMRTKGYDIVILDIMGVRGFDLLKIAVQHNFKVAMLTAHALNAEALKKSYDMGARAFLPKDQLGNLVPFLEDILRYDHKTGWIRLLEKLEDIFDTRFEPEWRKKYPFQWD
jgi:DNA-binding response OmpR family regulator